MLHHLGWSLAANRDPEPLAIGRGTQRHAAWQALSLPDNDVLLIVHLKEPLPDLEEAFKNYEDLAPLHLEVRDALRAEGIAGRHVVLLDRELNAQLMDLAQEDILIDARGETAMTEKLLPLLNLNRVAAGSLTMFPRKGAQQRARELADWTRLWMSRVGAAADSSQGTVRLFFFWLHLARLVEHLGLMPEREVSLAGYGMLARAPLPAKFLTAIFKPLREQWNLLQGAELRVTREIVQRAHTMQTMQPCLVSYGRLSRGKFASEIFADAFSDEEVRLTGWRQMMMGEPRRDSEDPARWLVDPVVMDLDAQGFGPLLRQFDAITEDLRWLAREQAVLRERGVRAGVQMDVFAGEVPEMVEEETPRLALQHALRVRTARRDRAEVARLVLLAHAAEWHARLRRPDPIFPAPQIIVPAATVAEAPPRSYRQADPNMN